LAPTATVDYLINNAGINIDRTVPAHDHPSGVARSSCASNISGAFNMVKQVIEHMIARGPDGIVKYQGGRHR